MKLFFCLLALIPVFFLEAAAATRTHTRTGTIYLDDADPEAYAEYFSVSIRKFDSSEGVLTGVTIELQANWNGAYTFSNEAAGDVGQVRYTPHPLVWLNTRLPTTTTIEAEVTAAAKLQSFAVGVAGAAQDIDSGTVTNQLNVPAGEMSEFIGAGATTADIELADLSTYENLSTTPALGTFVTSMYADCTVTVTYTYTPTVLTAVVVHVDLDATGVNDGSSWSDAFTDLQTALAFAVPGNEIWIAEGTYHPAAPNGDGTATFSLRSNISWYGGFAGDEITRVARDPVAHPTILSGDLNDDDGGGTGVNAIWYNMGENSNHVVTATNLYSTAVIDGFTITRGRAVQATGGGALGAGMTTSYCDDLQIANCTFTGNIGQSGAALYNATSLTTISGSIFSGNLASGGRGGAIYHASDWQDRSITYVLTINDSSFLSNTADASISSGDAGAIWSDFSAPVDIDHCLFEGNTAKWRFANGNTNSSGGAMLIFGQGSRITNSTFRNNRAHIGGALWVARDTEIINCVFVKNEAFRQSVGIYDYGGYGGAIYSPGYGSNNSLLIDHCTFHLNEGRSVGGVLGHVGVQIVNSILYTNISTEVEATLLDQQVGGELLISNSCVKGLWPLENGNISVDPLFIDQDGSDDIPGNADDDLRLNDGSFCIDAGDNAAFPADMPQLDFAGNARFYDDPDTPDTGSGLAPITDMGAYEFDGSSVGGSNLKPVASFTHSISVNTVTFTDSSTDSDGTIAQWIWSFGDGDSSIEQNPVHNYSANGIYNVSLTVRDDSNGTDRSDIIPITVAGLVTGSVIVTSPASNATVSGNVSITVDTTPDIERVKLYIDGAYVNVKNEISPFSLTWSSGSVADGVHTIELKANDDSETDEGVFWSTAISVTVLNATPVEIWKTQNFSTADLANSALEVSVWGDTANPDFDQLDNATEYALGTDPHDSSDGIGMIHGTTIDAGQRVLTFTFRRRNDDPSISVVAEVSMNLLSWSSQATQVQTVSAIDQGNGYDLVTAQEVPSSPPSASTFGRVSVTQE